MINTSVAFQVSYYNECVGIHYSFSYSKCRVKTAVENEWLTGMIRINNNNNNNNKSLFQTLSP